MESDNTILISSFVRCFVCNGLYQSESIFDQHQLLNTSEEPFKCLEKDTSPSLNYFILKDNEVKKVIIDDQILRENVIKSEIKPTTKEFQCNICEKYYPTEISLSVHKKQHNEKEIFKRLYWIT